MRSASSLLLAVLVSLPIATAAPASEPRGEYYYNAGRRVPVVQPTTSPVASGSQ